jgi:hypothetical protein
MRPRNHSIKTTLALTLALGAIAPTAASARPIDTVAHGARPSQDLRAQAKTSSLAGTPAPPQRIVTVSAPRGFDWGDAGIGAAGGLAIGMIALGGGLVITGSRRHGRYATPR